MSPPALPGRPALSGLGRLDEARPGRVVAFAPERGTGVVEAEDGRRFGFHCVEIADGTRCIDEGAAVVFRLRPSLAGELEARQLVRR